MDLRIMKDTTYVDPYYIQERKRFLWWTWWDTLQKVVHYSEPGFSSYQDLRFGTLKQAEDYIDKNFTSKFKEKKNQK